MIFGNIQNLKEYFFLEDGVFECFNYMKEHALNEYKKRESMRLTGSGYSSISWNMRRWKQRNDSGRRTGIIWIFI